MKSLQKLRVAELPTQRKLPIATSTSEKQTFSFRQYLGDTNRTTVIQYTPISFQHLLKGSSRVCVSGFQTVFQAENKPLETVLCCSFLRNVQAHQF